MRLWVLVGLLAVAGATCAHARAGGGDNYSGGDSGSSYSSTDSISHDGSSDEGFLIVFGLIFVLFVVLPALLILDRVEKARRKSMAIEAFRSRDPGFSEDLFLRRTEAVFRRVQEAWSAGDMTPTCALLSDGVFERFQLLLDLQRREGRRNTLASLKVRKVSLEFADLGTDFDTVDVRIAASCADRYFSTTDGSLITESKASFVEYWSFLRAASARGRAKPGPAEGFCPGCGAGLLVNAAAVCAQCKCWVNSGEFDWVLAEITQHSHWEQPIRWGPAQDVEDRASMLFWRWQRCLAYGNAAALEGWCSPEGLAAVMDSGVGRTHYERCGVGSVRATYPTQRRGLEAVTFGINWSGREGGTQAPSHNYMTLITLARKPGTRAAVENTLRSAHCGGCGAAIPPAGSACAHCGTSFKDPAAGWILVNLHNRIISTPA